MATAMMMGIAGAAAAAGMAVVVVVVAKKANERWPMKTVEVEEEAL